MNYKKQSQMLMARKDIYKTEFKSHEFPDTFKPHN